MEKPKTSIIWKRSDCRATWSDTSEAAVKRQPYIHGPARSPPIAPARSLGIRHNRQRTEELMMMNAGKFLQMIVARIVQSPEPTKPVAFREPLSPAPEPSCDVFIFRAARGTKPDVIKLFVSEKGINIRAIERTSHEESKCMSSGFLPLCRSIRGLGVRKYVPPFRRNGNTW